MLDAIGVFAWQWCILVYDADRQFPDPAIAIRRWPIQQFLHKNSVAIWGTQLRDLRIRLINTHNSSSARDQCSRNFLLHSLTNVPELRLPLPAR